MEAQLALARTRLDDSRKLATDRVTGLRVQVGRVLLEEPARGYLDDATPPAADAESAISGG